MSTRRVAALVFTLSLAGCTAPPPVVSEPDLEDADPDAMTWVAPAVGDAVTVGVPMDLVVYTGHPDVHAVAFAVDGVQVAVCDAWSDATTDQGDCNADTLWRATATLATAGRHHVTASFDLLDGTHGEVSRDVTAATTDASDGDPESSSTEPDPVPAGASGGDEPVGVDVQALDSVRGYLDPSHGWMDHGGELAWRVAGQRILVRPVGTTGDGRAEIGDVDAVTACIGAYGDAIDNALGISVRRYADLGNVSRATVVALALAQSGCTSEPDELGNAVGLMRMPAAQCAAEWAAAGHGTISPAVCRQQMLNSTDFAILVATLRLERLARRTHHDPVELAAAFTSGGVRASRANRFHLASEPGSLDDFVEAYNAYRSWESQGTSAAATASGVRPPAAQDPGSFRDPCAHPGPNAIRTPDAAGVFIGTEGDDVIVGTAGDDEIHGRGGHDVICGRGGNDHLYGDDGNDYIDAGSGNDYVEGGAGDDVIHGRDGSDELHGGPGDDALEGDLLDDDLYGEDGNDYLIGGHGTDYINGGTGDDLLRGDTGRDTFVGAAGDDTLSFVTTTPHGASPTGGVHVDFTQRLAMATDAAYMTYLLSPPHDGAAPRLQATEFTEPTAGLESGDGNREFVLGVEHILGSSFDDTITRSPTTTGVTVDGGLGNDVCDGRGCDAMEAPVPTGPYVLLDESRDDATGPVRNERGLVVLGGAGADGLSVKLLSSDARVLSHDVHATIASDNPRCVHVDGGTHTMQCTAPQRPSGPAIPPLRYVVVFGGAGDDRLRVDGAYPRDTTVHINGGDGNDELYGGSGQDVMFTGLSGHDTLYGNRGDDALLSEGGATSADGDALWGGHGNDQLVVDYICATHRFSGGDGLDIAGFRRSGDDDIVAELGGRIAPAHIHYFATGNQSVHGRSFNPAVCGSHPELWTRMHGGLEILEASDGNDQLFGDDTDNTIWAWGGNDVLHGNDGDDQLYGDDGDDEVHGDDGVDRLLGGPGGNDRLYSHDGRVDAYLSCGPGGGQLVDPDPGESASDCH